MSSEAPKRTIPRGAVAILCDIFASDRALTYVCSVEEERLSRLLRQAGEHFAAPVWTWTSTRGMVRWDGQPEPNAAAPREALSYIAAYDGPGIFHLRDFHQVLTGAPELIRRLRDLGESCFDRRKFIVISSPVREIPQEIERDLAYLELQPPDHGEMIELLREETGRLAARGAAVELGHGDVDRLASAVQGLTFNEVRHALRRAVAQDNRLGPESITALLEEKRLLISRSGVVEFIAQGTGIGQVGGLENLKKWVRERRRLFEMRESLDAEIVPKGVLMMGIPGCGKSLSAKAVASEFDLPMYRVNMIEIFSGRHGPPAVTFVQACRMLENLAPAVVWFDEIEMGITSADSTGEQGRIFAFFLTWMQEKARGLFVAATANRIDLLPAEMIRKGRFDEIFFVDLPGTEDRIEIFRIHLSRRGIDPSKIDLNGLLQFTKNWSGAEIEQCVISSLTRALAENRELTWNDLVTVATSVVPLAQTMKEQVGHIREWAFNRAVRASATPS